MTVLSDTEIRSALVGLRWDERDRDWSSRSALRETYGGLVIVPLDPDDIQPASVDVHLSPVFRVFDNYRDVCIDPRDKTQDLTSVVTQETAVPDPFILHPGEFVLGSTVERVEMPTDLVARVEGKSSLGRLGLQIHSTAGFIDPGFRGTITLELSNVARLPIKLFPGMAIGQVSFMRMGRPAAIPYGDPRRNSKYQDQTAPVASRYADNDHGSAK